MTSQEKDLLVRVATKYYLRNMTQSQIAKELYLSRPTVSRLLKQARDEGVVNISVNYSSDDIVELKELIKEKYKIHRLVVTPTFPSNEDNLKELGKAGARVLYDQIHDGTCVGVSWGRSVRNTVKHVQEKNVEGVRVVEVFGAVSYEASSSDSNTIGNLLASKVGGSFYSLAAPLYVDNPAARRSLIENPIVKNSLGMIENLDFLITGLGAVESFDLNRIWSKYLGEDMKRTIRKAGGVGFICAHFFDAEGNFLDIDINQQIIGIEIEQIKRTKIICVAGGIKKKKAIKAALKSGLLHTLITDEDTLRSILEERSIG